MNIFIIILLMILFASHGGGYLYFYFKKVLKNKTFDLSPSKSSKNIQQYLKNNEVKGLELYFLKYGKIIPVLSFLIIIITKIN